MSRKPLIGVTPYVNDNGERYVPEGYLKGIIDTGCEPYVIDYMTVKVEELPAIVEKLDAMVFSGGVDVNPVIYGEEDWPDDRCAEIEAQITALAIGESITIDGVTVTRKEA